MWLPRPLYEAIPYAAVVAGAGCVVEEGSCLILGQQCLRQGLSFRVDIRTAGEGDPVGQKARCLPSGLDCSLRRCIVG